MLLTTLDEVEIIYKISLEHDFEGLNVKIIQSLNYLVIY